ncbi:MAG: hypothetical protein OEZ38_13265, partial [Gammaproteobacteria bacterium]|nr:hypothetical protein [Gammaproteobacteria bacterium]
TDLPLNFNRHYLRTRLREEGVAGEVIDAFMGHWELGQEPFGRYSSLSPIEYRSEIKNPLERILADDQWQVIKVGHYGRI